MKKKILILGLLILSVIDLANNVAKRNLILDKLVESEEKLDYDTIVSSTINQQVVTVTTYEPVEDQCDSDPLITADNSKINLQKLNSGKLNWVAVSRDLLDFYNYGDKILIKSNDKRINGIYEIHDTMNKRYSNRIDILSNNLQGLWKNVIVEGV